MMHSFGICFSTSCWNFGVVGETLRLILRFWRNSLSEWFWFIWYKNCKGVLQPASLVNAEISEYVLKSFAYVIRHWNGQFDFGSSDKLNCPRNWMSLTLFKCSQQSPKNPKFQSVDFNLKFLFSAFLVLIWFFISCRLVYVVSKLKSDYWFLKSKMS